MNRNFLRAGQKLAQAFAKTIKEIKPGVSLLEIEVLANEYIDEQGGKPGFKMVDNYDWATCININDGVVHGVPDGTKIKPGDIVSLDMGLYYRGWHSDMAYTKEIRSSKHEIRNGEFLAVGEKALEKAIDQAKPGNRVGHISHAIEDTIGRAGYRVIPRLTGHGVGRELHQDPMIPGVLSGKVERTPKIKAGMGLAIEVIYTKGSPGIKTAGDGWTIVTKDGKMSSLFEKTVLVTKGGAEIITPYLF
jgi:methionyl aminopeptidase